MEYVTGEVVSCHWQLEGETEALGQNSLILWSGEPLIT